MSLYEAVTALCEVIKLQSEIIEKQTEVLAQVEISESAAASLAELRAEEREKRGAILAEYN